MPRAGPGHEGQWGEQRAGKSCSTLPTAATERLVVRGLGHACDTNSSSPCSQVAMTESTFPLVQWEGGPMLTSGQ